MTREELRRHLERLDWGRDGLDRDGIVRQWPDFPAGLYLQLPPDYRFRSAGAVLSYLDHVLKTHRPTMVSTLEPTEAGGGHGASGSVLLLPPRHHGIGVGTDAGPTGSSAQTGAGREGTTYGGEEHR